MKFSCSLGLGFGLRVKLGLVGKSQAKLERTERSWKEPSEVGKLLLKLEIFAEVRKFRCSWKVLAEIGKFE